MNLAAFLTKVSSDAELQARLSVISPDVPAEQIQAKIAEIAAEYGVPLTTEDSLQLQEAYLQQNELTDVELQTVAGGIYNPESDPVEYMKKNHPSVAKIFAEAYGRR